MDQAFSPDCKHFVDAVRNRRPARLPLYEHSVSPGIMEQVLGCSFAADARDPVRLPAFFREFCRFFRELTYDVVSFEVGITSVLPRGSALSGGRGAIQSRADFEQYEWDRIADRFWDVATPRFEALTGQLPPGMKIVGGVGNGVFELAEALVGLEYLPFIQVDDPGLYADIFRRIGDTMHGIWDTFLGRYGAFMAAARVGDDLGFRSSLLTNPATVREHIVPQYARVIDLVHARGLPFLWHSCGCIFEIMDDFIALGIDAKHSNEDAIAPFARWIERYGGRIGLLGGFDMDFLCQQSPETVYEHGVRMGSAFRRRARGYAMGSGNSIPDYVPVPNYLALVRAAQEIRRREEA